MPQRTIKIVNTRGLHARSAAKLVALAKNYKSKIELHANKKKANCQSMMSLMILAAGIDTKVKITSTGPDAKEALNAICSLINAGFNEED